MIRPGTASDLDAIAEIYEEILAAEDARPVSYTNWQRGKYPTRDTARAALEAGTLWVVCEEELRRQGKKAVRLDTYEGNVPANAMYPRLGYSFAGATEFFFQGFIHEVLNCYEKAL